MLNVSALGYLFTLLLLVTETLKLLSACVCPCLRHFI